MHHYSCTIIEQYMDCHIISQYTYYVFSNVPDCDINSTLYAGFMYT